MAISRAIAKQRVEKYFETFNQQAFEETAALFADDGALTPPFEGTIVGQRDIQAYLEKKAANMCAHPQAWSFMAQGSPQGEGGQLCVVEITGRVEAIVFQVGVSWHFEISSAGQISAARVKLMASPKELLSLKPLAR